MTDKTLAARIARQLFLGAHNCPVARLALQEEGEEIGDLSWSEIGAAHSIERTIRAERRRERRARRAARKGRKA